MDTNRNHGALADQRSEEIRAPKLVREPSAEGIRLLEDWELALAGGGDYGPEWP